MFRPIPLYVTITLRTEIVLKLPGTVFQCIALIGLHALHDLESWTNQFFFAAAVQCCAHWIRHKLGNENELLRSSWTMYNAKTKHAYIS